MTTTTTIPARMTAGWFKLGAIVFTTFLACWTIAIWYWHQVDRNPGTVELAFALLVVPLGVLLGIWRGSKAFTSDASLPAATSTPAAASANAGTAPAIPLLAIVGTALRSPYGTSADELAGAIADNEARADLDKELVDDHGFPVMAARCDDAQDDMLQDEIAEWLAGQGMQLHLAEEQWRALILATGVTAELASQAAGDLMPTEGNPPRLQLALLLPDEWTVDVQRAASSWLKHTVSQYGWPEASIVVRGASEGDKATPTALLTALMPGSSPADKPAVSLVIACASLIGQESVDRLAAQSSLFTSLQSRGQVPGEGVAGLLLTDLQLAQSSGSEFALLGPLNERRRDSSADEARRVDSTLLLEMTDQVCKTAGIELAQIDMVVADTAHRPNRVLELMGLSAPAIPQIDASDDIVRIGLGSGSCGAVPFVTVLALARHYAFERGAPVLCIGNEDPWLRSAALVRPPA